MLSECDYFSKKQIKNEKDRKRGKSLKAKIKLILALIPMVILVVYGIELGIRVLTADGKAEYLVVVLAIVVLLLLVESRFYRNYKTEKRRTS